MIVKDDYYQVYNQSNNDDADQNDQDDKWDIPNYIFDFERPNREHD